MTKFCCKKCHKLLFEISNEALDQLRDGILKGEVPIRIKCNKCKAMNELRMFKATLKTEDWKFVAGSARAKKMERNAYKLQYKAIDKVLASGFKNAPKQ